ncbi:hypothetical protein [Orbus mooreae]|uniref:hypothetical protein n=1 Tax=Orbus mooreae TaxID=3074107 RepID=UPI00370D24F2
MAKKADMKLQWTFGGKVDPNLIAAAKAVKANIDNIKKAGGNVSKSLSTVTSKAGSLVKYLSFGALAGGVPSLMLIAKGAADAANNFKDLSDQTAISVQSLSEWSHAASMNGLSNEEFIGSVKFLNKTLSGAAQGSQQAIIAFKRAGVNIYDSAGKIKNADQIMLEASDTFKKMPEGIYKSSLAMALFGNSGNKMVSLMQGGSAAINELRKEAQDLGIAFTDADASAGAEFNDSLNILKKSVQGVSFSIGKQLYPIITPLVKEISTWVKENRALISSKVSEWINKIKDNLPAMKKFIVDTYSSIKTFITAVDNVVTSLGGWGTVLKVIAGAFIAIKAIQLTSWVIDVIKVVGLFGKSLLTVIPVIIKFGLALLANPVGLVIAGIAALIAAGYLLYENWDTVCAWIENIWNKVKDFFSSTFSEITAAFDEGFITGIMTLLTKFNPLSLIAKAIDSVFEYFTGISLIDEGGKFIQSFADGIISTWQSIKDSIVDTVTGWIPDWMKSGASAIGGSLSSAWGSLTGYANGGLITHHQVAQLGEDGPEMVIPLTKSNGPNLLFQAVKIMGLSNTKPNAETIVGQISKGTTQNNTHSSSFSPSFNPNITINCTRQDDIMPRLNETLDNQRRAFEDMFNSMMNKNRRVGAF